VSSAAKAVFLDRDGVINRRPPEGLYIGSVAEFAILPGVSEAIAKLNQRGYLVFVVTNQRCIARGIVPADSVEQLHQHLLRETAASGAHITHVYVCPHDYADACECRKPNPGMLLEAARSYSLDMTRSWMVGDSPSDIAAGRAAGCRTVFLGGDKEVQTDINATALADAVEKILALE